MSYSSLTIHIENKELNECLDFICSQNICIVEENNQIQVVDKEGYTSYKKRQVIIEEFELEKDITVNYKIGSRYFWLNLVELENKQILYISLGSIDDKDINEMQNNLIQKFYNNEFVKSIYGLKKEYSEEIADWEELIVKGGNIDINHFSFLGLKNPLSKVEIMNLNDTYSLVIYKSNIMIFDKYFI